MYFQRTFTNLEQTHGLLDVFGNSVPFLVYLMTPLSMLERIANTQNLNRVSVTVANF